MILTVHTTTNTIIDLPHSMRFSLNPVRQQTERISLAGSVIRQVSTWDSSTGSAVWSGLIDSTTAEQILTAYEGSPFATIDDGSHCYVAVWTPEISRVEDGGSKRTATIRFDIIRRIF